MHHLVPLVCLTLLAGCPLPSPSPAAPDDVPTATSRRADTLDAMRANPLRYTRHARCRMECRHISEAEVGEILHGAGRLDPSRTRTDGQCPSHALEGETSDDQRVRIVYAQCPTSTKVITVIDLGRDWPCGECR